MAKVIVLFQVRQLTLFQKLFLGACQNQVIWRIIHFTMLISVFFKSNWFMWKFTTFFKIFPLTYLNYISSIPFISGGDAIFNPGVVNCLFWLKTNAFSPYTCFVLYCFPMSHCVYEPWLLIPNLSVIHFRKLQLVHM